MEPQQDNLLLLELPNVPQQYIGSKRGRQELEDDTKELEAKILRAFNTLVQDEAFINIDLTRPIKWALIGTEIDTTIKIYKLKDFYKAINDP